MRAINSIKKVLYGLNQELNWLNNTLSHPPQWNSLCRGEEAYALRSFTETRQQGELNWPSQYNRHLNRSTQRQCQDLSQYWLDIRKTFSSSSTLLGVVQFDNICSCAASEWLPMLVRRKVAMLRAFTVGF